MTNNFEKISNYIKRADKSALLILDREVEKSIEYIKRRGDKITTGEALQELGHIKGTIKKLLTEYSK